MENAVRISGHIVDAWTGAIRPGTVLVVDGRIGGIGECAGPCPERYILPGFVDAHIHVESSMLMPSRFAAAALEQGTLAAVCDPHEIANVLGVDGIKALIEDGRKVPFVFAFGAPSCVPATSLETSGASVTAADIERLFVAGDVSFLGEVMNVPGVLSGDAGLAAKLDVARRHGAPIDGHAPGLVGEGLAAYAAAGIGTDHECVSVDEALEKIRHGMHVMLREGSAARNFDALLPLFATAPERLMLCSDDKHPDELAGGHINVLVRRALAAGVPLAAVLRAATLNPVAHYRLPLGLLRPGDSADFIVVEGPLERMVVGESWLRGVCVMRAGRYVGPVPEVRIVNRFERSGIEAAELAVPACSGAAAVVRVIGIEDGQLVTRKESARLPVADGAVLADPSRDILKLVVVNRYDDTSPPAVAFVRGFGIGAGALASSVAHDSHNIIAVGGDDAAIVRAVNRVAAARGGIAAVARDNREAFLGLPFGGLVAVDDCRTVAAAYRELDSFAKLVLGSALRAPFMTLSFMALLVIPQLKLGDRGLFDGDAFCFVPVVEA